LRTGKDKISNFRLLERHQINKKMKEIKIKNEEQKCKQMAVPSINS